MKQPVLVVMAAGMGSRYGGLKQIDPIGKNGEFIIDYSLFDAKRAGFNKVIFVINRKIESIFKEAIGKRIENYLEVEYAFQDLTDIPNGYTVPENREKPWGTAHAIYAARKWIEGPFAVINADDFYGKNAFEMAYNFLANPNKEDAHAMVGYELKNTVTDNGHVSRGVCKVNDKQQLIQIDEILQIEKRGNGIAFTEDAGKTWTDIVEDTIVSMNLWCFDKSYIDEIEAGFPKFLDNALANNPLKGEYYAPSVVSSIIESGKGSVKVLRSTDKWHGITYKEDKPEIVNFVADKTKEGIYPCPLWQ